MSLDEQVAEQIDIAAREDGVSFSGWLSAAAEHQLILRSGRRAMAEWDREDPLTDVERAAARTALDRALAEKSRGRG
ncbi:hypothetical protein D0Z08_11200 [Nocardioides immobilis]|uniref:CopG family transcriptional regulator n=1 Tax=Nocardioides immobilis TaxID=2049295 RepID=A0A417Y3R2_9ACTN|nr:hypothetical protein D0Z08_11200 [Nocardioides immobilis]